MDEAYSRWLDRQIDRMERRIEKSRQSLPQTPQALCRLRGAMMQRHALEDARDYARIAQLWQERTDRVRDILAGELRRQQISPWMYQQVMAVLNGKEETFARYGKSVEETER